MIDNINFRRIENDIETHDVVVYMNGTPMFPRCCSSAMVAQFLDMYKVKYTFFNLMEEISLLDSLKQYTQQFAVPQLFIKGKFIGSGEDLRSMFLDGLILKTLKEHNLTNL